MNKTVLWTIGHSNRSVEKFLKLLKEHNVRILVDIRRFPTSKVEHFKREEMEQWLPEHGVEYVWFGKELGGYRRGGYQAYLKTKTFREGIERLLQLARKERVCIMCMEKNPKYCHRRFVSAYLERRNVEVRHILEEGQVSLMKFEEIM
ncbi:DUF488 domain-containing protein [Candidatus Bathyarchaeota archaeon]|nr:MAG: DUF488 domain-containing protein [Candidatus Bathyarchaeota archaeon]